MIADAVSALSFTTEFQVKPGRTGSVTYSEDFSEGEAIVTTQFRGSWGVPSPPRN